MKPWVKRPIEIRNLFNPAFCGLVLHRSITGFQDRDERGLPFSLALLVLPLSLHQDTRAVLQAGTRSYFLKLIAEHPELQVDFAQRCEHMLPFCLESLGFLMSIGAITVTAEGFLQAGGNRVVKAVSGSEESKACQRVAAYLGRQFALIGDRATIYATLGVRP